MSSPCGDHSAASFSQLRRLWSDGVAVRARAATAQRLGLDRCAGRLELFAARRAPPPDGRGLRWTALPGQSRPVVLGAAGRGAVRARREAPRAVTATRPSGPPARRAGSRSEKRKSSQHYPTPSSRSMPHCRSGRRRRPDGRHPPTTMPPGPDNSSPRAVQGGHSRRPDYRRMSAAIVDRLTSPVANSAEQMWNEAAPPLRLPGRGLCRAEARSRCRPRLEDGRRGRSAARSGDRRAAPRCVFLDLE